mmetsp:Transcript_3678/g.5598  ORF Transcript_3678/g.5598 Transcript_3678/m.5598 type:complete len:288 (-) Transcript_3678:2482-3345(-)
MKFVFIYLTCIQSFEIELSRRLQLRSAIGFLYPQITSAYCDDTCIFQKTRQFQRAGRTLLLRQEFGPKAGTGMGIWECAEVLSEYLDKYPEIVSGRRVQELGCGGSALCSIVASLRGATAVQATDGDADVLSLARYNLDTNDASQVETRLLRWEHALAADTTSFDVVLGADVTYYPDSAQALANALLASSAPVAYIAHKRRRGAEDDATIATLEREFGRADRINFNKATATDGITLYRLNRRTDAPADLSRVWNELFEEGTQCNPGYSPLGHLCVLNNKKGEVEANN